MGASGATTSPFYDAFISYGRLDSKNFAIQLSQCLVEQGLRVWFDQNDIPLGVDFQAQIDDGLEKSHNFLFIIAPHSINSPYCAKELDLALKRNKRIIPLLHVEQVSRETWQTRNPKGTDAQWQEYQAKGLHSSFINMHPEISKINWVYFRETLDDFEKSLQGLVSIFHRHRDYLHQHTALLTQALEWERNQKQTHYLLIGEQRQQAERWLKYQFKEEQPPSEPTLLHSEFICESIKNANNLMTQVFLAHAETDGTVTAHVRNVLLRWGITVWVSHVDIQTGETFEAAIARGIEQTDTVVYLLSPNSLQSQYCQRELDYALNLNKRIIPLLIEPTDLEQIPESLRSLQFIDFISNVTYQQNIDRLLKALQEDAAYYEEHKILLTKALKWERQNRNPAILLRGYNLRRAEDWLRGSQQRSQYRPTQLQETFIAESLQQPPAASLDVFVSYSRADSEVARRLNDELQIRGKMTWFDQESIASGSDFQQEIYRGIESANTFLFILSPRSISSPYCADEVEYAQRLNKRIVSILHQPIETVNLHPALAKVQWIDFSRPESDFYTRVAELTRTLETDQESVRSHTRLTVRALEWERAGHDPSFLLRGTDLVASEQWLKQAINQIPAPTDLQVQYIRSSRKAPLRQATPRTIAFSSLAAIACVLGVRFIGLLQPLELISFDQLVRSRPHERTDPRFLVIEITEDDIQGMVQRQEKGAGASLSDESLYRLLQKLDRYQPRLIGLDLYRDFPVNSSIPALSARLRQDQRFIGICKLPHLEDGIAQKGTLPPPEVPLNRVAFSDVNPDPDAVIRRQAVWVVPPENSPCQATQSFGFLVAHRYLQQVQGSQLVYEDPLTSNGNLRLGHVTFQRLGAYNGGYQGIDPSGFQILLNYRAPDGNPSQIADRVTLGDFLSDQVDPGSQTNWKDRIVLIGITSQITRKDYVETPYGRVPGVFYQAQVASQILSTVLDGRPLLHALPPEESLLWIGIWSLVGGLIVYRVRSPLKLGLAVGGASIILVLACGGGLVISNLWMPLVPALLALLLTAGGALFITAQLYPVKTIRKQRS